MPAASPGGHGRPGRRRRPLEQRAVPEERQRRRRFCSTPVPGCSRPWCGTARRRSRARAFCGSPVQTQGLPAAARVYTGPVDGGVSGAVTG